MPRVARQHVPSSVTHVITRFADGKFIMDDVSGARAQYLARLDQALAVSDWRLLWYCLMGSHVHLGMVSGRQSLDRWIRGVNSGFAGWVNRRGRMVGKRSRGPVVAERPTTIMVPAERAGYLAAYIHNNPRRAGVVQRAADSRWSSHRAYVLGECGPRHLEVGTGLALCGLGSSGADRSAFDRWVAACAGDGRDPSLSRGAMLAARRTVRAHNGRAAEVATPSLREPGLATFPVHLSEGAVRREQIGAPIAALLLRVARLSGVDVFELARPGRSRRVTRARRIAALACREGERAVIEVCVALGISDSAASYLIRTASESDKRLAQHAAQLWRRDADDAGDVA